ncbi:MAG: rRNA pseudouridine synthase [Deltaproteobacteria bacterium]|nr:rRNA pseudouridine synthase [Deltaproteobacteria bacterium]
MEERLQKLLSNAGIASRREAEDLIRAGRVTLNGKAVTELGTRANPAKDDIRLDGERVFSGKPEYYVLYKPRNVVTTLDDDKNRPHVGAYVSRLQKRVFPVGRLDFDSEGLLLLTNDGEFSNRVMHPRYKVPKTYLVKVKGRPDERAVQRLRTGVMLEDGPTLPARVELSRPTRANTWLKITVYEGRNRIIRRMCERVRFPVVKLHRIGVGAIYLGKMKPGELRKFTPREMAYVKELLAAQPDRSGEAPRIAPTPQAQRKRLRHRAPRARKLGRGGRPGAGR